jgi:hypothetical protein
MAKLLTRRLKPDKDIGCGLVCAQLGCAVAIWVGGAVLSVAVIVAAVYGIVRVLQHTCVV